jgi:hypothetical protein
MTWHEMGDLCQRQQLPAPKVHSTPSRFVARSEADLSRGWLSRCRTEAGDAHVASVPVGGVFWLFHWRLLAPDNSERRLPGGLKSGAGPLVVLARADPAWFVARRARPRVFSSAR